MQRLPQRSYKTLQLLPSAMLPVAEGCYTLPMLTRRHFMTLTAALSACAPAALKESTPSDDTGHVGPSPPTDGSLSEITPNETFYITTYSPSRVPGADWVASWSLSVGGLVAAERSIDLEGIKALGGNDIEHTLECISNSSSHAIGNAIWTGVPLSTLLSAMGVEIDASATHLWFHCGDDYSTSVPLGDLPAMWAVWEMNGEALPMDHGWPVRILTPGRYGMKNPKWLSRIEMAAESIPGTWEVYGWSDDCTYHIHSWIHSPAPSSAIDPAGTTLIGCAYAGSRAVVKVEVSQDGGLSWAEATLDYAPGPNIWVLWSFLLVPAATGPFEVLVRATTEDGEVQADLESSDGNLDGFEGLDSRNYTV